jgi:hypothetical protein
MWCLRKVPEEAEPEFIIASAATDPTIAMEARIYLVLI